VVCDILGASRDNGEQCDARRQRQDKEVNVILPDVDFSTATEDEIIAAYVEEGLDEGYARAVIAIIRNPPEGTQFD